MKSIIPILSDADLATRIGIAFSTRPRIVAHGILASVRDGIVTLRGAVPTPYDRYLVVALTRHVAGVFGIDDQLHVAEPLPPKAASKPRTTRRIVRLRSHHRLRAGLFVFAIALASLTGCGSADSSRVPVHPASGAIQFRGKPVSGAFVSLHPKGGNNTGAPSPRATVGPDGTFALSTYEGQDGAPEGDYVLTVQWYKPIRQGNELVGGPNVLPPKYSSANTSDLLVKIAAGENQLKPIHIR
jgi:hypothetical protein